LSEQRDFFRDVEREYWAQAEGLKDEERRLIAQYLDPERSTLDAGTGGGRIPRALAARGFRDVTGFDFAPELIAAARTANSKGEATFDVADATALPYDDQRFDQALYLQQMICTIDDPAGRDAALREAARVLRPGGRALFSFVCLESRLAATAQRAYVAYLRAFRTLRRDRRPVQSMPRLRLSGRLDLGALRDAGPYNWWYRAEEAEAALKGAGFEIEAIGFGADAEAGTLRRSAAEALAGGASGTLYASALRTR
jgi:SAM-dependent methyltransferase